MKNKTISIIAVISLLFLPLTFISYAADLTLNNAPIQVFFSPKGGCTGAIINKIDQAKTEILKAWIERKYIRVLNVAGPRASKDPKIYDATVDLLDAVLIIN